MSQNILGSQIVRATLARLEADRQEAIATIQLYVNASAGVGDHSDVVTAACTATAQLAAAEQAIQALERNFLTTPTTTADDEG